MAKHELFTRAGFHLDWEPEHRFFTKEGKERWVENYYFGHENTELIDFCHENYRALKDASYTFTGPDYKGNDGWYRLSFYYDKPKTLTAEAQKFREQLQAVQSDLLAVMHKLSLLAK